MPDSVFKVGIDGDPSGLKAAAGQAKQSIQSIELSAKGAQTAIDRAMQAGNTSTKKMNQNSLWAQYDAKATMRALDGVGASHKQIGLEAAKAGKSGQAAFGGMASKLTAVTGGAAAALAVVRALKTATEQAHTIAEQKMSSFTQARGNIGDLATTMGVSPDTAFTLANQAFNAKTSLNEQEGMAFRLGFRNSGQQYRGTMIPEKEFDEAEEQFAQLAAVRGLDKGNVGDYGGSLIGATNRMGMGDKASDHALGKLSSGLAILGSGKGKTGELVKQLNTLSASTLSDEEFRGIFQDSDEVATVISVAAEASQERAGFMAEAAIRGMRRGLADGDEKIRELKEKAGVTAQTPFIESIKRIAPLIEAEARAKNVKIQDIIRDKFGGEEETRGLSVLINQGVGKGLFDARINYGKEHADPSKPLEEIKNYLTSPDQQGGINQAAQQLELQRQTQGAITSITQRVKLQAKQALEAQGQGSTVNNLLDNTVGLVVPDFYKQNAAAANLLKERGAKVGLTPEQLGFGGLQANMPLQSWTSEGQESELRRAIEIIAQRGGNPFGDGAPTKELVELLREVRDGINNLQPAKAQPAQVAPLNPGVPNRGGLRP